MYLCFAMKTLSLAVTYNVTFKATLPAANDAINFKIIILMPIFYVLDLEILSLCLLGSRRKRLWTKRMLSSKDLNKRVRHQRKDIPLWKNEKDSEFEILSYRQIHLLLYLLTNINIHHRTQRAQPFLKTTPVTATITITISIFAWHTLWNYPMTTKSVSKYKNNGNKI